MIRDEFIKQQKEEKLSTKEMQKIRKFGERVFYTKEINRITNYTKALNFSAIMVAVMLAVVGSPVLVVWVSGGTFTSEDLFSIIAVSVMAVLLLCWFLIILPLEKRKVKRYKIAVEELREKESQRQKIIFKNYVK